MTTPPSPFVLFNLKVTEFLRDLDGLLGDVYDFVIFKQGVQMISLCDEPRLAHCFLEYVATPYRNYICSRDEVFFLDNINKDSIRDVNRDGFDFTILDIIKGKWCSMTDDDKNAVWAHLELLVVLCDRCIESLRRP
jgi:hypothetical protein